MAKKTPKPSKPAKKIAKPIAKKSAPVKKTAKPVAKKVAKPAPKKAVKPVAKKVVKPAAKKVIKPIAKKAVKPVAKKSIKPFAKKVVKPVAKKAPATAPKKVIKPIPKKVTKPVPKKPVKVVQPKIAPKSILVKGSTSKTPIPVSKGGSKPAIVSKAPVATPVIPPVHVKPVAKNIPVKKILVEKGEKVISNTNTPFNDKPAEKEKPVFTSIVPKKTVIEYIGKTRYSDVELEEFRKLINEKLASAKKELDNLKEALNNISDNSAADTESSYATFEDGSATQEKEHLSQMAARQRKFIGNLDAALVRIENKTYGICAVTGKLIPKERLRAVPHTTVSIEAKLGKV